jgi:ParB family chromosome partitioning protein
MNPPYSRELLPLFVKKFCDSFDTGGIVQALVLVNNATETEWFYALAKRASAICFPKSRVRFSRPNDESGAPLQGQAIFYFGKSAAAFMAHFEDVGIICHVTSAI